MTQLLGNRILIKPLIRKISRGGIELPEGATQKNLMPIVVAVGTGRKVQPELQHGMRVITATPACGQEIEWNGQMVQEVRPADIVAIVGEGVEGE
jgi:co-chaperonin GroES (HSP10)